MQVNMQYMDPMGKEGTILEIAGMPISRVNMSFKISRFTVLGNRSIWLCSPSSGYLGVGLEHNLSQTNQTNLHLPLIAYWEKIRCQKVWLILGGHFSKLLDQIHIQIVIPPLQHDNTSEIHLFLHELIE